MLHRSNQQSVEKIPVTVRKLLDIVFDTVNEGLIVGDSEGKIIFSNNAAKRISGSGGLSENPSERAQSFSLKFGDEDKPMETSDLPLLKVLREGDVEGYEIILKNTQGGKKVLLCNGRKLYDAEGSLFGALLVLQDKTTLRKKEREAVELVRERNELLRINKELERFAAIAAHDLKSPLNSITQLANALMEDFGETLGSEGNEMLCYMLDATKRLRALIDDLLAYAKSDVGLGEKTFIDTKSVVHDVLLLLRNEVEKSNARIEIEHLPVVSGSRVGLSQIFQNLISNALKYKSVRQPVVHVSCVEQVDEWLFEISDNGIGIKPEDQPSVFELFKRVEGSSGCEGTGLGLPICKRIVELHGGRLWLSSERGRGTSLFFTLPKIDDSRILQ